MTSAASTELNRLSSSIIGAAIRIHRAVGPGLLENAHLACLVYELRSLSLSIQVQKPLPLIYANTRIDCAYRADIMVEEKVLVEVKALEALAPIHSRQLFTYLRIGECPRGLLLNFGAPTMKEGIKRIVNGFHFE